MTSTSSSHSSAPMQAIEALPASEDRSGSTLSLLPTMLNGLVQGAADLVQHASVMMQNASELVVGPPAPVEKEAPPLPLPQQTSLRPLPPTLAAMAHAQTETHDDADKDDTTPTASVARRGTTDEAAPQRASLFSSLTTSLLHLASGSETASLPPSPPRSVATASPSPLPSDPSCPDRAGLPTPPTPRTASSTPSRTDTGPGTTSRRSATRQLTADGLPFSTDPLISAMQRIPDRPASPALSTPSRTSTSSSTVSTLSLDIDPTPRCDVCTCRPSCPTWSVSASASASVPPLPPPTSSTIASNDASIEGPAQQNEDIHTCPCAVHLARTRKRSRHFHRVEQIVKGTKRVAREIRNGL